MVEHMLKSTTLPDYRFPFAIFVSKLIDYFEVDTTNERNDTIKAVSEIDNSTLMKMGFHKEEDGWVLRRNAVHHEDGEEENAEINREEEHVQHMDESPIHSFVNEDVAATNYNAFVAYQAPENRGDLYQCLKDRFWTGWTHSQMIKRHISK